MRKAAAILLLTIFAFNTLGYRLLFDHMAMQADSNLEASLNEDKYRDQDLISIKQPIQLPYYTNNQIFQRIDGEVNINGTLYKFVKCRIYNDSLEMMCIPNLAKMQIQQSKTDFFKLANDLQQQSSKKKADSQQKSFKSIVNECEEIALTNFNIGQITVNHPASTELLYFPSLFLQTTEQPPDTSA